MESINTRLYDLFVRSFPDDGSGPSGHEVYTLSVKALFVGTFVILVGFAILLFGRGLPTLLSLDRPTELSLAVVTKFVGRLFCYGGTAYVLVCYGIVRFGIGIATFPDRFFRRSRRDAKEEAMFAQGMALLRGLKASFWLVMGFGVSSVFEVDYPLNNTSLLILLVTLVFFFGTISLASRYATAIIIGKALFLSVIAVLCFARLHYGEKMSITDALDSDALKSDFTIRQEKHEAAARVFQGTELARDKIRLGSLYNDASRIRNIISQDALDGCRKQEVEALTERINNAIEGRQNPVSVPECGATSDYWAKKREGAIVNVLAGAHSVQDENILGAVLSDVVEVGRLRATVREGNRLNRCWSKRLSIEEDRIAQFRATGKLGAEAFKLKGCAPLPSPANNEQEESSGSEADNPQGTVVDVD